MSLRKERRKKRVRGRGTEANEFRAIQQALSQTEKGGKPQEDTQARPASTSAVQYFSPKLVELETPPWAVVNLVRFLEKCGVCESKITLKGKCTNPDCQQDWGDPKELTENLVSDMVTQAKALHSAS